MSDTEHCGEEDRKPEGLVEVPSNPCTSLLMQAIVRFCTQVVVQSFETINWMTKQSYRCHCIDVEIDNAHDHSKHVQLLKEGDGEWSNMSEKARGESV